MSLNSEHLNNLSKQITSPVPFWFLNGQVEEWHIVREFEMMADKGIGDVIVHPRYGLQCEYLSDEWFEIFGWCVREAKKHGMCVWIYDELNWPSGTAGNSVMKIDPDYRGKYLAVESKPLERDRFRSQFEPGAYMIAANIEGGVVTKTRVVEDVAAAQGLTGNWRLFNCTVKYDRVLHRHALVRRGQLLQARHLRRVFQALRRRVRQDDPRGLHRRALDLLGERGLRRLEPALHRRTTSPHSRRNTATRPSR